MLALLLLPATGDAALLLLPGRMLATVAAGTDGGRHAVPPAAVTLPPALALASRWDRS